MPKGITTEVIIQEDHFEVVKKSVTGEVLKKAARAGGGVIETNAKMNASSGRPGLNVDTGNLVNSIKVEDGECTETHAEVTVGPSNVEYARIHEFGGVIKPTSAKMLAWEGSDGEMIFAHEVTIPARPYMRPAVDEHKDEIRKAMEEQIQGAINEVTK